MLVTLTSYDFRLTSDPLHSSVILVCSQFPHLDMGLVALRAAPGVEIHFIELELHELLLRLASLWGHLCGAAVLRRCGCRGVAVSRCCGLAPLFSLKMTVIAMFLAWLIGGL